MIDNLFFCSVQEDSGNKPALDWFKNYCLKNPSEQLYLISSPLGKNKYSYEYEGKAFVILSPKHRIIFLDIEGDQNSFEEYYQDFIEDLGSISDKFNYRTHIGRPRKWQSELTVKETFDDSTIEEILGRNRIKKGLQRKNELLISLLLGSINDVESIGADEPETLLEKVKNKIVLFDGEQTRFIYQNEEKKSTYIQGLSGTGKTELLLHKLKEIYTSSDEAKVFFTCHNIALANTLRERIPNFFNFMKVDKQIKWGEGFWVDRAWGSARNKDSGLYSYICHFYGIQFSGFSYKTGYKEIFSKALEEINKIKEEDFEYPFDYILVDERQDFPDCFFELCEKVAKEKVYIAGDIFQDIFESNFEKRIVNVDYILNRCYRTDPRTLMFSHAIGMGLFENEKLNWLTDVEWEASGYTVERNGKNIHLRRESIRRFEELNTESIQSMYVEKLENLRQIIKVIEQLKVKNPTLEPDDVAVIILDDNKTIYQYIDKLEYEIVEKLGWKVNKAYESKRKLDGHLFISNKNNVKGLEFPFVICITASIKNNYRYRNTLYTMLTRSFIQSYLLIKNESDILVQQEGLKIINSSNYIETVEPSDLEKNKIRSTIIKLNEEKNMSAEDFLAMIFDELKMNRKDRNVFRKHIPESIYFDEAETIAFIEANRKFYCK